jgi:hypothetical protein
VHLATFTTITQTAAYFLSLPSKKRDRHTKSDRASSAYLLNLSRFKIMQDTLERKEQVLRKVVSDLRLDRSQILEGCGHLYRHCCCAAALGNRAFTGHTLRCKPRSSASDGRKDTFASLALPLSNVTIPTTHTYSKLRL